MTSASPTPPQVNPAAPATPGSGLTKQVDSGARRQRKPATVSWYGAFLIFSMLLIAVGWELFRWILAVITLD